MLLIKGFTGDPNDQELNNLTPFLLQLAKEEDFRPVASKYSQYCSKLLETSKESITSRKNSHEQRGQGDMLRKKGTNDKTKEFISKNTTRSISSPGKAIEGSANDPDEGDDDGFENVDENSHSQGVNRFLDENSSFFAVIKSKSGRRSKSNKHAKQVENSILLTFGSKLDSTTPDVSSLTGSQTKINLKNPALLLFGENKLDLPTPDPFYPSTPQFSKSKTYSHQ